MQKIKKINHQNRWPPYWPTGRLADNREMRNLTDNSSKMSNETYSEAMIGQFHYFISGQIYRSFFID